MSNIPTPIRAALGLAAAAVDEARKLPATLPQAVSTVPMVAISTAVQASFRLQQHLAALTARGDEVISQLRGTTAEAPDWATFDEPVAGSATPGGSGSARERVGASASEAAERPRAAFDRIDYSGTGFDDGDDEPGRWDAVGVGGTEPDEDPASSGSSTKTATAKTASAKRAPARSAPPKSATAKSAPAKKAAGTQPAVKSASTVKSGPAKAGPPKAGPTKASPAKKASAGKATAKKAAPGGPKPASGQQSEPIEEAARRAKPADTPNPATMAAEIVHAHEAEHEAGQSTPRPVE